MKPQEFEGKTIDEAIDKACDEWHVSRDKLNIEIIADGTAGFLGILGKKQAKIKAAVLSLAEPLDSPPAGTPARPSKPAPDRKKPAVPAETADQMGTRHEADENTALLAKTIVEGILTRMNIDVPVTIRETADQIILNIEGNGSGLLIGRRGQNLDALQYIVNKSVHKSPNGRKMIVVDTESYRQRREETLTALAAKIGEKVKKTKKAVTLNYLNAHNRRIIHLALQDETGITTKSRGEGEYRKLIIVPVKKD